MHCNPFLGKVEEYNYDGVRTLINESLAAAEQTCNVKFAPWQPEVIVTYTRRIEMTDKTLIINNLGHLHYISGC
jgi:hypothetical protein